MIVASIAIEAGSGVASGDVLNFEDLPPLNHPPGTIGTRAFVPEYHGFIFTSNYTPYGLPDFNHRWALWHCAEEVQIDNCEDNFYELGSLSAYTSGEHALGNIYHYGNAGIWSITRADGGLWTFDGAWFTAYTTFPDLIIRGYVGNTEVLGMGAFPLAWCRPRFWAPTDTIAIDRLEVYGAPNGYVYKSFLMDDFHYTLVPSPSALALLCLVGASPRRRRV